MTRPAPDCPSETCDFRRSLYTGNGHFIHAPRSGGTASYASLTEGYYRKHFVSTARFWNKPM